MPKPTTNIPAAFSRLHVDDSPTDRVIQDIYDKLAQVQTKLGQHDTQLDQQSTQISQVQAAQTKG